MVHRARLVGVRHGLVDIGESLLVLGESLVAMWVGWSRHDPLLSSALFGRTKRRAESEREPNGT
jgi:hypothetical protein